MFRALWSRVACSCVCLVLLLAASRTMAAETLSLVFTPTNPGGGSQTYIVAWLSGGTSSVNKRTLLYYGTITGNYYNQITTYWSAISGSSANATNPAGVDAKMGATQSSVITVTKNNIDVSSLPDGNYTINFAIARKNNMVATTSYAFNKNGTASSLASPVSQNGWTLTTITYSGRPTYTMTVNAGNNQTATVNTTVATAPSVIIKDGANAAVSGVSVTFAVASGGGSVTTATTTTNASGIATVGSWKMGTTAGTNTLTATASGVTGSPLTFTAIGTAGAATTMAKNGTATASATVGTSIASLPSVKVTDSFGNAVSGTAVTFAVTGGGGSATGLSQTTNASGIATVTSWTLGTTAGANTMTATASGLTGSPLSFTCTGVAGAASVMTMSAGNNQTAQPSAAVTTPPAVLVTDSHGNPVAGVAVTFAVASGGGSITGANATTGANGIAAVGSWTLGPAAGTNTVTATASGLSGSPLTFTATGLNSTLLAITAGNNQTAVVGTAVATAPTVLVKDTGGAVVNGATVTFTVASGGGTLSTSTATSNASGVATYGGTWTLGHAVGTNTITASATISGIPTSVTFTATATVGPAAIIAKQTGDSQSATVATAVTVVPTVLVTDQYGNPVSGKTVAFVASGNGAVGVVSTTSNASGIASVGSWTLTTTPGANTLTVTAAGLSGSPLTFTATAVVGAPTTMVKAAGDAQTATVGTAVATAPRVQVRDSQGNGIAGVAVTFAVGSGSGVVSGGSAMTDGSGYAAVATWTLGTTAGTQTLTASAAGLSTLTFSATATAAAATQFTMVAGDGQTAAAGTAVAVAPQVQVRDSYNNVVVGVTVTFTVTAGGGSVTNPTTMTDVQGLASAGAWTLGSSAGTNTVDADVSGLSGSPLTFTATATVDASAAPFVARVITVAPGGQFTPKNVVAMWIETSAGAFVRTIGDWSGERRTSLTGWAAKAGSNDTDAVMGATRTGHSDVLTATWNLTAKNSNTVVVDGAYRLCVEVADSNPGGSNRSVTIPFSVSGGAVAAVAATTVASGEEVAINAPLTSAAAGGGDQSGCGIGSVNALLGMLVVMLFLRRSPRRR